MATDPNDPINRPMESYPSRTGVGVPSFWTLIIPLLAGTALYFAITENLESDTGATVWSEELLEASPAVLVGLLFEILVLLPLWLFVARLRAARFLIFSCIGALIWLACGAVILRAANISAASEPWADAAVMLPGVVIVIVFAAMIRYHGRRR
jgi:hypothetical protein